MKSNAEEHSNSRPALVKVGRRSVVRIARRLTHWQLEVMRGMRVDPEDVMAAARTKQIGSVFAIKYAVLERNGTISIIKREGS